MKRSPMWFAAVTLAAAAAAGPPASAQDAAPAKGLKDSAKDALKGATKDLGAKARSAADEAKKKVEGALAPASADGLIKRSVFFGNPDKAGPQLSNDGKMLSYLAPVNGVMNVWVGPIDKPDAAKPVTQDTSRGVRQYFWAYDNAHLLYVQDKGGDENWHVLAVDVAKGETKDLTPIEEIKGADGEAVKMPNGKPLRPAARVEGLSEKFPDEVLIGLNTRDPQYHDVYRLNVKTGEMTLHQKNEGYAGFTIDDDFRVRFAQKFNESGGMDVFKAVKKDGAADAPAGEGIAFEPFETIAMEDAATTNMLGFDKAGETVYMLDSRGRDTAALVALDLKTGDKKVLAENPRADIAGVLINPQTKKVEAASATYDREQWTFLDPAVAEDFKHLRTLNPGEVNVGSRSLDDKHWLVAFVADDGPVRVYHYDRPAKKATFLFANRAQLEGLKLARMHPQVIPSRDGKNLVSYLTLPVQSDTDGDGRPDKPLPMVLFVHGGPWARDTWGFNGTHQWLANRGYAVLSVNFRSSTGFGKGFTNAGNREWAGKMHDDLIDAVNWAVENKVADKDKVAIMGGSYGGYATLVGLTFTPDTFACGVDIVGPSNIVTLLNTIPPYWLPAINLMTKQVGDHRTEEGRTFLESRSPLTFVDKIKKPLLIGQGANDPRVKQTEADQIVKAMQAKGLPVTYVLFPDEGHGFARPENRMAFNAVTEAFLAKHLGGKFQPVEADFKGSSVTIPTGAEGVPGVEDAVSAK